jgi:peptidyl-Lys metalloendopeptidase
VPKYSRKYIIGHQHEKSFTVLEPGKKLDFEHDLSAAYNFSAVGAGIYTVEANNRFFFLDTATNTSQTIYAETSPELAHRSILTGQLAVTRRAIAKSVPRLRKRAEFESCSAEQQKNIADGALVARKFSEESLKAVTKTDSKRYETWFGKFDQKRHAQIYQNFKNLNDNDFSTYTYDCGECANEKDIFAYVYPDQWGMVYLCGAFWEAPNEGTNSRGGTIYHEASHFNENANTEDHSYGQDACKTLAKSDPAKTVKNADSHEYFVENDPPL